VSYASGEWTVSQTGIYKVGFSLSFAGSNGKKYEIAIFDGESEVDSIEVERKLGSVDVGAASAGPGFMSLTANDTLSLRAKSEDGGSVMYLHKLNVNIERVR